MGTPRITFPEFRLPGIGLMTSLPVTQFPAPPMPAGPLPRPRASVPTHTQARKHASTQARKHASTCSDNLSEIPVGVDPMGFTVHHILRRPTASAAFRMLVGVFGGGKWLKEKSLCISKGMDSAFGKSLEKYRENTDLLLETIKRSGYGNMSIIYVAYLDSIGWNFDGPAPGWELLCGMDSPLAKTLSAYHEEFRPPREPRKRSKDMKLFDIAV